MTNVKDLSFLILGYIKSEDMEILPTEVKLILKKKIRDLQRNHHYSPLAHARE